MMIGENGNHEGSKARKEVGELIGFSVMGRGIRICRARLPVRPLPIISPRSSS